MNFEDYHTPINGTIRYNDNTKDFEGYLGYWKSFTYDGINDSNSNLWSNSSYDISYNNSSDIIGIGTINPKYTLDINGSMNIYNNLYINNTLINVNSTNFNILYLTTVNTTQLNLLSGVNTITNEFNYLSETIPGNMIINKTLVTDSDSDIIINNLISNNITINNDLYVYGNYTYANIDNIDINDTIFVINGSNNLNSGLLINNSNNSNFGIIWYNNTEFILVNTTTSYNNNDINISNYLDLKTYNININDLNSTYLFGNAENITDITTEYVNMFNITNNESSFFINDIEKDNITLLRNHKYLFNITNVNSNETFNIVYSNNSIISLPHITYLNDNFFVFNVPYNIDYPLYYESNNTINMGGKIDISNTFINNNNNTTSIIINNDNINIYSNDNIIFKINNSGVSDTDNLYSDFYLNKNIIISNGNISSSGYIGNNNIYYNNLYINYLEFNTTITNFIDNYIINTTDIYTNSINSSNIIIYENNSYINIDKWQYYNYLNGNVGINTDSPIEKLHVIGNVIINGNYNINNKLYIDEFEVLPSSWIKQSLTNNIYFNNNVGINIDSPTDELTVLGTISATKYIGNGSLLSNIPSTRWIQNNNNELYTYVNIKIGTNDTIEPDEQLHVNGGIIISNELTEINGCIQFNGTDFTIFKDDFISLTENGSSYSDPNLWSSNLNDVYFINNVSIGTSEINNSLNIYGNITINSLYINNTQLLTSVDNLNILYNNNVNINNLNNIINLNTSYNYLNYLDNTNIGIGTPNKVLIQDNTTTITNGSFTFNNILINSNLTIYGNQTIINSQNFLINESIFILLHNSTNDNGIIIDENNDIIKLNFQNNSFVFEHSNYNYIDILVNNVLSIDSISADYFLGNATYIDNLELNKWTNGSNNNIYFQNNISIGSINPSDSIFSINGSVYSNSFYISDICFSDDIINTGIKTNIPNYELDINGTFYSNSLFINTTVDNNKIFDIDLNDNFIINNFIINSSSNSIIIDNADNIAQFNINSSIFINNSLIINDNNNYNYTVYVNGTANSSSWIADGSGITNIIWEYVNSTSIYDNINGNIGININNPNYKLHINNNLNFNNIIANGSDLTNLPWNNNTNVYFNNNVGINNINPIYDLDINGTINSTIFIGNGSNITNISNWSKYNNDIYTEKNVGIFIIPDSKLDINTSVNININNESLKINNDFNIYSNNSISIGTSIPNEKLHVNNGNIRITNGSFIDDNITIVPDYVFNNDYNLMNLNNLNDFININKHLPNINNKQTFKKNGIHISSFELQLLEKIEELILYTINQQKEINNLIKIKNIFLNEIY